MIARISRTFVKHTDYSCRRDNLQWKSKPNEQTLGRLGDGKPPIKGICEGRKGTHTNTECPVWLLPGQGSAQGRAINCRWRVTHVLPERLRRCTKSELSYIRVAHGSMNERMFDQEQDSYALAGVAQWIECQPANPRVASSIPSQAHAWVAGQVPIWGCARGDHTLMFPSLSFSFPSPLSKDKILKRQTRRLSSSHQPTLQTQRGPGCEVARARPTHRCDSDLMN